MRRSLILAFCALLAALPAAAQDAAQQARLAEGRKVAELWCANCHLIAPDARGPAGDAAPPFQVIARMPETSDATLRAFLRMPHANMPDHRLSRAQLDGITAWILALRPGG
ncbi:MAG: c-type cytochrome [Paracraurococcus sp.]|jgi:mono/diheme cytochrome c family protein